MQLINIPSLMLEAKDKLSAGSDSAAAPYAGRVFIWGNLWLSSLQTKGEAFPQMHKHSFREKKETFVCSHNFSVPSMLWRTTLFKVSGLTGLLPIPVLLHVYLGAFPVCFFSFPAMRPCTTADQIFRVSSVFAGGLILTICLA